MVATDIAARGIHVDGIGLVIHADSPAEHKAYLHRSGRTARAGMAGTVITLQTPAQAGAVRTLMRKAGVVPLTATVTPGSALLRSIAGEPPRWSRGPCGLPPGWRTSPRLRRPVVARRHCPPASAVVAVAEPRPAEIRLAEPPPAEARLLNPARLRACGRVLLGLQPAQDGFKAGGEALVAVAVPGVHAIGGQVREAGGGQGAEELVQLLPGRGVVQALLGGRRGIGEGEAEGVVVDEAEGQGGLAAGQPGPVQRREECLGQGQRRGASGSRVLSKAATPGWPSRTTRSRRARPATCAVHGVPGSAWQSTSPSTASRMRS